jgi:AcrR family transcriptional regulator
LELRSKNIEQRSKMCQDVFVPTPQRSARRSDALSRERIVAAAIEILDADGEPDLTFRALTARLSTGAGAIYHHVANKNELLAAATDDVLAQLFSQIEKDADPAQTLRAISLGIFDAIDAHPWVGVQLSHDPLPAVLRIWKAIGEQLQALEVTGRAQSNAGSALVSYVLGAAAQHVAGPRTQHDTAEREAYLETLAERLTLHDPDPLVGEIADQLPEHDDRAQFLAGVDIFLTGIIAQTTRPTPTSS